MRLSTSFMYQKQINSLNDAMARNNDVFSRISQGQNLLRPSDDPAAAAQAVRCQNTLARYEQFATARTFAQESLGQTDTILSSVFNELDNAKSKVIHAGSDTLSDSDRASLADELSAIREHLLSLANTRDSNGRYLFAGYKTDKPAFTADGQYQGGSTPISQKVADDREMQVTQTGDAVFINDGESVFSMLDKAIDALQNPVSSDEERDALHGILDEVNVSLRNAIDNVSKAQSTVGVNLQHIDTLNESAEAQEVNVINRLQSAVGSDANSTITMVAQSQMSQFALNASMMVFQSMQEMSLFNLVR